MEENRRAHYRIAYPDTERARFAFGMSISEVLECSERGLRFRRTPGPIEVGTRVKGRIAMRHGKEIRVAGTIVWMDDESVALNLDRLPIPFLAIMREQLYLRHAARQFG